MSLSIILFPNIISQIVGLPITIVVYSAISFDGFDNTVRLMSKYADKWLFPSIFNNF